MPYNFPAGVINDLETVISPPRFGTYLIETRGDRDAAMQLYCWNTDISAAFYYILQFCELAIRNAVVEALEQGFGRNWHLSRGFRHALPTPPQRRTTQYFAVKDLDNCVHRLQRPNLAVTAGKVVAELKFAFWGSLFVSAQDPRLWAKYLAEIFPGMPPDETVPAARAALYNDIEVIRRLRNRIAHHEPIFSRDLHADFDRIMRIIRWRRPIAAGWLETTENVTHLLDKRPKFAL